MAGGLAAAAFAASLPAALACATLGLAAGPADAANAAAKTAKAATAAATTVATAPGAVAFTVPPTSGAAELGGPGAEGARTVAALPDGSLLLAGLGSQGRAAVARLLPSGALDPSFGAGGVAIPAINTRLVPLQVLPQPNGGIVVVGEGATLSPYTTATIVAIRLTSTGALDRTFGARGMTVLGAVNVAREGAPIAAVQPDGEIVIAGEAGATAHAPTPSTLHGAIARLTPQGGLDASFGTGGIVSLAAGQIAFQPLVQPGGDVAVLIRGGAGTGSGTSLLTLDPTGVPDAAIGNGQPVPLAFTGWEIAGPGDGSTLVLGGFGSRGAGKVARYTASGLLDPTFGPGGVVRLASNLTVGHLLARPDGTSLVIGYPGSAQALSQSAGRVLVQELDATGNVQPAAGGAASASVTLPLQGGSYTAGQIANLHAGNAGDVAVALRPDGSVALATGVEISEYVGQGEAYFLDSWGAAVLSPPAQPVLRVALSGGFGASANLHATAAVPSQKASADHAGVTVSLTVSHPALAVVSVRAGSGQIAQATVPLWTSGARTVRVPLTPAGNASIGRLAGRRVQVSVALVDATATAATASASARLR